MKRQITKIALGLASLLFTLAIPAHASEVDLYFTGSSTGGTVTVNGSNTVTGISGVPFDYFVASTGSFGPSSSSLSLSGTTLELDGTIPDIGINSSIELLTIQLASPLTNAGNANTLNVPINYAAPVTVSTTLLTALGITGPVTSTLFGGGGEGLDLLGSGSSGSFEVNSDDLTVAISPTPEPASLLLFASGLVGIALYLSKKRSEKVRL